MRIRSLSTLKIITNVSLKIKEAFVMTKELGKKIKDIRKKQKLTLKNIAEATGFSISFLSQLERGKSSATLESLKKIAIALNTSPAHFFDDAQSNKGNGPTRFKRIAENGIYYQNLAPGVDLPDFMPMRVTLNPREQGGKPITHAGQEFIYILEGTLTVEVGHQLHQLESGESLFYEASEPHYWYNCGDDAVSFICVSSDTKTD